MNNDEEELLDEVDVEEEAKAGRLPKAARRYRIRIDREKFDVEQQVVTGRLVLSLVGKTPEGYLLSLRHNGQVEEVGPDEKIDLREKGVERFMTLKRDPQEGYQVRREFFMPPSDQEHLEQLRLPWETVLEGGSQWLLIHNFPVGEGYDHASVTAALLIQPGYPDAQLDMVYVYPPLARVDGQQIPNLADQPLEGKVYQRWSRHRPPEDPWRVGVDDLGTHLVQVSEWFRREFRLRR